MFKVRSEQIRVFQPSAEEALVVRVAEYLRENHGADAVRLPQSRNTVAELPGGVLREMVKGGISRARGYGLEWKSNLKAFVALMFVGAPNFNEYEKAAAFLSDEAIPAEERIDKLLDELRDEDWEAIEKNYNPHRWNLPSEEHIYE